MNPPIVMITGNVHYPITLDPSVWIFDPGRIDLASFLEHGSDIIPKEDPRVESQKMSRQERKDVLEKSFGIPIKRFVERAEPKANAKTMRIHSEGKTADVPLDVGMDMVAAFSHLGKPLKENGPLHLYYADLTNKETPFTTVTEIEIV
ncbi:hypothetical protein G4V62_05220 [Bacillaceae bacterium SIJ1]|uniref:hypothetical protein n=1 Tax=Litoribacterium kuwaitense TaxID=1398745 RepID=UPI0013EB5687|nr:hypothetical protein [Litoribacterium kuwaitense]NGP44383.1 hypothetical protein [Litoribacterium kuwaitense]